MQSNQIGMILAAAAAAAEEKARKERLAKEEQDHKAYVARQKAEEQARKERLAKEEQDRKAYIKRQEAEEQTRKERLAKEEQDLKTRKELLAKEEQENKKRLDKEEQDRKANIERQEAERKQQADEILKKEQEDAKRKEIEIAKEKEEQEARIAAEETTRGRSESILREEEDRKLKDAIEAMHIGCELSMREKEKAAKPTAQQVQQEILDKNKPADQEKVEKTIEEICKEIEVELKQFEKNPEQKLKEEATQNQEQEQNPKKEATQKQEQEQKPNKEADQAHADLYVKAYKAQERRHKIIRYFGRVGAIAAAIIPPLSLPFTISKVVADRRNNKSESSLARQIFACIVSALVPGLSGMVAWQIVNAAEDKRREQDDIVKVGPFLANSFDKDDKKERQARVEWKNIFANIDWKGLKNDKKLAPKKALVSEEHPTLGKVINKFMDRAQVERRNALLYASSWTSFDVNFFKKSYQTSIAIDEKLKQKYSNKK